mmetsp:Transcript_18311/g.18388  ORF Transcript_18311/g.18388 Transcript_18311/m.18388 type:complete len:202 (-) Transcript_18311:94-699(-)|eukprot:CAMPEP_0182416942 /NCGR_PEP_ID=MMETSP1167-20130531/1354_1 /TAXON_ID=2988 /ORGANISM="Mallomonas Sp, Strain CCMP3275" /LENGTH=201 /DNA_ID=CAMNT_0024590155 /DNA_START=77 /DNA_END=682 /DNA_ORIENTATION=+
MFNPSAVKDKSEQAAKKKALKRVKDLCLQIIPPPLQEGLIVDVNEQICGDPACSPIDTVIMLVWKSGGRGIFGVPLEPKEVEREHLEEVFPDEDILAAWKKGEDVEWPRRPELRFEVNTRVECRIGPNPLRDWAPGTVVAQYYSEAGWPAGACAPYQIQLDDGRLIYAPQDNDNVIRLLQDGTPPPEENGNDDEDDDEDES